METEQQRKQRVKRCEMLIKDVDHIQDNRRDYGSYALPKAKKLKLPSASLDTVKLYAEHIIQHGGSTNWQWLRLMEPLGETRQVLIAYGVIEP